MKKFLLASAFALGLATTPASADVMVADMLSGTGDNVVFDSFNGTNQAVGSFNGTHSGFVTFTDLSNTVGFIGSANGNDIKIANTSDLLVQVLATDMTTPLSTSTDVFSLKGGGDVTLLVNATDGLFTFDLGLISPTAQSGFTLTAINGEVINNFTLLDNGGVISDFEHYRVDVAAVPGPVAGAGLPGLFAFGMLMLSRLRKRRVA